MRLTCNIDQRGSRVRLLVGVITDVVGVSLLVAGIFYDSAGLLVAGVALSVAGGFMIFEGARGWCALRAFGIKTPL